MGAADWVEVEGSDVASHESLIIHPDDIVEALPLRHDHCFATLLRNSAAEFDDVGPEIEHAVHCDRKSA